ncbi:MAG: hypothetical protein ACR2J8_12710 [Thermomicrobiales bacterium]
MTDSTMPRRGRGRPRKHPIDFEAIAKKKEGWPVRGTPGGWIDPFDALNPTAAAENAQAMNYRLEQQRLIMAVRAELAAEVLPMAPERQRGETLLAQTHSMRARVTAIGAGLIAAIGPAASEDAEIAEPAAATEA